MKAGNPLGLPRFLVLRENYLRVVLKTLPKLMA
jgi:hypothetical protein